MELTKTLKQGQGCQNDNLDIKVCIAPATGVWIHQMNTAIRLDFDNIDDMVIALLEFKKMRDDK